MESSVIYRELRRCFHNHLYQINNQYIYAWESDFFAMSTSDYCIEVEVKVSLGDYRKDFLKEKHRFFRALWNKQTHLVVDQGKDNWSGNVICKFRTGELETRFPQKYRGWDRNGKRSVLHWFYNTSIQHKIVELRAPCHRIRIHDLNKSNIPNKFYFAVPEGMNVTVPEYAGLITVSDTGCTIVKQAPFLHKRKLEIWKTLLDKFYYKYRNVNV